MIWEDQGEKAGKNCSVEIFVEKSSLGKDRAVQAEIFTPKYLPIDTLALSFFYFYVTSLPSSPPSPPSLLTWPPHPPTWLLKSPFAPRRLNPPPSLSLLSLLPNTFLSRIPCIAMNQRTADSTTRPTAEITSSSINNHRHISHHCVALSEIQQSCKETPGSDGLRSRSINGRTSLVFFYVPPIFRAPALWSA